MKILTMPDAHALFGTRNSFPYPLNKPITCESEVLA